eukprot:CAMPEP_0119317542 /NCGR_PEP_ID=MMETSP1333-20130426/43462_1 /TAXON_ID=418940 /ORGANISM="Scyphosphaera apsteinii, Strain RCC1455" /LENGTH=96 /DNA_ID=CAMNT_0007323499 /DNA_START=104 /DNA_END=391 /DNA_ORIENTATION=+
MTSLSQTEIDAYLAKVDVKTPLEQALNGVVATKEQVPIQFFAAFFKALAAGKTYEPKAPLGKAEVEDYLNSVDLYGPLTRALNEAVSSQATEPIKF